jgi:hypothetical protein
MTETLSVEITSAIRETHRIFALELTGAPITHAKYSAMRFIPDQMTVTFIDDHWSNIDVAGFNVSKGGVTSTVVRKSEMWVNARYGPPPPAWILTIVHRLQTEWENPS